MARKKKPKIFRAVTAVKAAAREHIGTVPASRRLPDPKKSKRERYKATLARLLKEE